MQENAGSKRVNAWRTSPSFAPQAEWLFAAPRPDEYTLLNSLLEIVKPGE
jgi:hypothetical protein